MAPYSTHGAIFRIRGLIFVDYFTEKCIRSFWCIEQKMPVRSLLILVKQIYLNVFTGIKISWSPYVKLIIKNRNDYISNTSYTVAVFYTPHSGRSKVTQVTLVSRAKGKRCGHYPHGPQTFAWRISTLLSSIDNIYASRERLYTAPTVVAQFTLNSTHQCHR